MPKQILVNRTASEVRTTVLEDGQCTSFLVERDWERSVVGNVYKGRVVRVLPGMQSAFVEVGLDRAVFLHASDVIAPDDVIKKYREAAAAAREQWAQSRKRHHEEASTTDGSESVADAFIDDPAVDRAAEVLAEGASLADAGDAALLAAPPIDDGTTAAPDAADGAEVEETGPQGELPRHGEDEREPLEDAPTPPRPKFRPRIEEMLRQGQEIVVQVTKEPLGTKGARVTMHLSLPGRFLVFLPGHPHVGVSRRIRGRGERDRLKTIIEGERQNDEGFIARTACEAATQEALAADVSYLRDLYRAIDERAKTSSAPALLHEDLDLPRRSARDQLTDDVDAMIVDDVLDHERVAAFIERFLPTMMPRLQMWSSETPLFDHFGVERQLERALDRRVTLPSGAYLVVDTTEALTAIDVNTGRFVGSEDLETTALQVNLEAVSPIVRELRLRDLGGLIVIDFIDMEQGEHRRQVYDSLLAALAQDPARCATLPISEFGLVEMTRRRVREDLDRNLTTTCPCCEGRARVKGAETVAYEILRAVRAHKPAGADQELLVRCAPAVAAELQRHEPRAIQQIARQGGSSIRLAVDGGFHRHRFVIETRPRPVARKGEGGEGRP